MKKILALCGIIVLIEVGYLVWRVSKPEHYGRAFAGAPPIELRELASNPDKYTNVEVTVSGKIVRQCPSAGCWFYLEDANKSQVRVEMDGVISTLPRRVGHKATAEGRLAKVGDEYKLFGEGVQFSK